MRRMLLALVLLTLTLSGCAPSGDTNVDPPPNSTKVDSVEEKQINDIVTEWKRVANEQLKADAVKPETIEERVYTSTDTLSAIQKHYNDALIAKGWTTVKKMTNTSNDQLLLLGYEHGTTALVVGAIDASRFGGKGVVIYTIKGVK